MTNTALYLFTLKPRQIHFAFAQMAFARRAARKLSGVTFAKLMGTGTGRTFTPSDADLKQWAILFVGSDLEGIDQSQFIARWRDRSITCDRYLLNPVSAHGKWSKVSPFQISDAPRTGGAVVAITRARLRWSRAIRFWKSIPPVVADLHQSPGLIFSIGIGEAPIGLQGTFSLWESEAALREFAYKNLPHRLAIENTEKFNWYSEELFARFDLANTADFPHVH